MVQNVICVIECSYELASIYILLFVGWSIRRCQLDTVDWKCCWVQWYSYWFSAYWICQLLIEECHMVILCLTFWEISKVLSTVLHHFTFPPILHKCSIPSQPCQNLLFPIYHFKTITVTMSKLVSHLFWFDFPNACDVKHLWFPSEMIKMF